MEKRTLGKTGMDVSALSFGASSLGAVFRKIDLNEAIRSVHPSLKSLTTERMAKVQALELHPGAARYYREIGVLK